MLAVLFAPVGLEVFVPSACAAGDGTGSGPSASQATPSLATAATVASPGRTSKKTSAKSRVHSPFVQLARRIDAEFPLCAESMVDDNEDFTISGSDFLRQEPALRLAFAYPSL